MNQFTPEQIKALDAAYQLRINALFALLQDQFANLNTLKASDLKFSKYNCEFQLNQLLQLHQKFLAESQVGELQIVNGQK
jgi:hypothetical protein